MSLKVDLNADLGESDGQRSDHDASLVPLLTSVSIACGFHAGSPETMRATVALANEHGVAVGAHPGLADPQGFGRRELGVSASEVENLVAYQIGALSSIAALEGVPVCHVKVHGALYSMAGRDRRMAKSVVRAVTAVDPGLVLFAPFRSQMAFAATEAGLSVACEAFADRAYNRDGTLTPRTRPRAVIDKATVVARRAVEMVRTNSVMATDGSQVLLEIDTLCVHSDTPGAVSLAQEIRKVLLDAGIELAAPTGH